LSDRPEEITASTIRAAVARSFAPL